MLYLKESPELFAGSGNKNSRYYGTSLKETVEVNIVPENLLVDLFTEPDGLLQTEDRPNPSSSFSMEYQGMSRWC